MDTSRIHHAYFTEFIREILQMFLEVGHKHTGND